jgi:hypothetical protein
MALPRSYTILISQNDWDKWISSIRIAAEGKEIWDYINPDIPAGQLPVLREPVEPSVTSIKETAATYLDLDASEKDYYKLLPQRYYTRLDHFKRTNSAVKRFGARIQDSIADVNATYIRDSSIPHAMLVALKKAFAPSDKSRERDMVLRYRKLQKAPKSRNLDSWLHSWELTYADARSINLPDVAGDRAVMDFLLAIKDTHTAFYSYWAGEIEHTETAPTLPDLVNKFRQRMRNEATGSPAVLGAFSASFQGLSTGSTGSDSPVPSSTQKERRDLKCVCGFPHRYACCYYLHESLRLANWKPNSDIQKSIDERLQKDQKLRTQIEKVKKQVSETQQSAAHAVTDSTFIATVIPDAIHSTAEYPLRDSFILDSGATLHVCNNMSRFTTFQPVSDKTMYAGS